jgi:hypothetical protein
MLNDRVVELLEYLDKLSKVQASGHYVNEEIKEVVKEVRIELGLEKKKVETLKQSRKLVFEAKLRERGFKNVSFIQYVVFEAVFGSLENDIEVPFKNEQDAEVDSAVTVLRSMKAPVKTEFFQVDEHFAVLKVERQ